MTGSQPPGDAIWPLPAARSVETARHTRSRIPPAAPAPSGVSLGACAGLSPSARVCAPQSAPRPRPPWAPAPPSSWLSPDTAFGAVSSPSLSRPSEISATWEQGPHPGPCCRSVCGTKEARTERLLTESPRRARWPRWGDSACSRRVRPAVRGRDTGTRRPLLRLRVRRRFLPGGGGSAGEAGASAEGARPSSRSWTLRRAGSAFSAGVWQTFLQFYLAEKPATA